MPTAGQPFLSTTFGAWRLRLSIRSQCSWLDANSYQTHNSILFSYHLASNRYLCRSLKQVFTYRRIRFLTCLCASRFSQSSWSISTFPQNTVFQWMPTLSYRIDFRVRNMDYTVSGIFFRISAEDCFFDGVFYRDDTWLLEWNSWCSSRGHLDLIYQARISEPNDTQNHK